MSVAKTVDKMGRLNLGREFAGKAVMVKQAGRGKFVLTVGTFIPEDEAWLYKNQEALKMVRRGLKESKDGAAPAKAPDLEGDAKLFTEED